MRGNARISVIIPAPLNEEAAIGRVLTAIPPWADEVLVVDNSSSDATAAVARQHGARVIWEPQQGYGAACLAEINALTTSDIAMFLDGDFSDHPEEMDRLVDPLLENEVDLVIGSRVLGHKQPGALTPTGPLRQLAALPAHPTSLAASLYRPGPLPGHPVFGPPGINHDGPQLWLDCGNADQSCGAAPPNYRGAGQLSPPAGTIQDFRHHQGNFRGRH